MNPKCLVLAWSVGELCGAQVADQSTTDSARFQAYYFSGLMKNIYLNNYQIFIKLSNFLALCDPSSCRGDLLDALSPTAS